MRRSERTRFSSASEDEVGGFRSLKQEPRAGSPPARATLDEVDKSLYETCFRSAVHNVVIEGDRHVEEVARFDALLDDGGLASDAADDQEEGLPGCTDLSSSTARARQKSG
jgi:hypothetical protein